jgi:hypothetical protein
VERGDRVAGEVDELGVAEHVGEHRPGALVVGVELARARSRRGCGSRIARHARRQADGTWRFVIDNPWGVD